MSPRLKLYRRFLLRFSIGSLPLLLTIHPAAGSGHDPPRRLFILPTAVPYHAGEVVFSLHELFVPGLAVGLTERLSVSGGVSMIPGTDDRLVFLAPKFTPLHDAMVDIALGFCFLGGNGGGGRSIGYASITCGDDRGSITLGAGMGIDRAGSFGGPDLMGGVSLRLTGETDILSGVFIPGGFVPGIFTLGTRWRRDNVSVELAVIVPWNPHGHPVAPVPWTSFSIGL